ncbi:MAG: MFS transporter [Comamonas sp.]
MSAPLSSLSLTYFITVASLAPLGLNVAVGLQPVFDGQAMDASGSAAAVALFALGLGMGQPLAGVAADRWGRRVTLLVGLTSACMGALISACAEQENSLLAGRLLAGLGLSTCLVVPRACLRDLHEGPALQRSMAVLAMVFAVLPAITPPLSWFMTQRGHWRAPLGLLVIVACAVMLLAWRYQPETRPVNTYTPRWNSWGQLVVQRHLQRVVLAFATIAAPFFIIASAGPAALQTSTGVDSGTAAVVLGLTYLGFAVGNQWVRLCADRSVESLFQHGLLLAATGIGGLLLTLLWLPNIWLWTLALTVYALGHGMVFPTAFALVLGGLARQAGLVTAGIGFVHMCTGALAAWVSSVLTYSLSAHEALAYSASVVTLLAMAAWFILPYNKDTS